MKISSAERFWRRVDRSGGASACWLFQGALSGGYGHFTMNKKVRQAHQVAYELTYGPIPAQMDLDHVAARGCTSKACCNPAHLEPVPHRVNVLRGQSPAAKHARLTHCKHGHAFTPENTRTMQTSGGSRRFCRTCDVRRQQEARSRQKVAE